MRIASHGGGSFRGRRDHGPCASPTADLWRSVPSGINTDPIWARAFYKLPSPCKDVMRVRTDYRVVHIPHPNQLKKRVSCGRFDGYRLETASGHLAAAGNRPDRYRRHAPARPRRDRGRLLAWKRGAWPRLRYRGRFSRSSHARNGISRAPNLCGM